MTPDADLPVTGEDKGAHTPTENSLPDPSAEALAKAETPPDANPYEHLSLTELQHVQHEKWVEKQRQRIIRELQEPPLPPPPEEKKSPPDMADFAIANAAKGLQECLQPLYGELPLKDVLDYLKEGMASPGNPADIEKRLETQARTLDSAFGRLIEEAMKNRSCNHVIASAALKTQKHYRDTIRALHGLDKVFAKLEKERDKKMTQSEYWRDENENKNKD
jgi:hypothetical protein